MPFPKCSSQISRKSAVCLEPGKKVIPFETVQLS